MFNKALIIGILLVGATFSVSANEVQKWEYKCVETNRGDMGLNGLMVGQSSNYQMMEVADFIAQEFNQLGEKGWEMVGYAMNDGTNARIVCFKRRYDPRRPLYED